ncbi:MAG: HPr kinase/phosphorylase [Paracoccaceae bacterium]
MTEAAGQTILHGTAVAVQGRGLLITGASGVGKSSLGLALIGLGALLVSDDQTRITVADGLATLSCPNPDLSGVIEARGVGLLRAEAVPDATLTLVVDLDRYENERLPPRRSVNVLGCVIDLVYGSQSPTFPIALMLQLRHGRHA